MTEKQPRLRCKLAIVSTHPIQYYAPVFRTLAQLEALDLRVFYTWSQAAGDRFFDPGFGTDVQWDIPLLEGYAHQFVANVSRRPGAHHFWGLQTPTLMHDIELWKPDAVLIYTWNSWAHLRALRYFKGRLPVLFRGDSTLIDRRSWWRAAIRRVFLSWVYSHVDVAIAVGTNNRNYFRWCGVRHDRIALAPHSIDTVRFANDAAQHEQQAACWRRELGIDASTIVFLFAGKLQHKKNPCLLLDAFLSLETDSHLIFVGSGELEDQLRSKSVGNDRVHFMSFRNQSVMPAVYRLGDVFVLPSQGPEETWGLALNEAMASGRAVIASDKVGGACDLIETGKTGWMFASGDAGALTNLLGLSLALGKTVLHSMGCAAQATTSRWSTEESARLIAEAVLACTASP